MRQLYGSSLKFAGHLLNNSHTVTRNRRASQANLRVCTHGEKKKGLAVMGRDLPLSALDPEPL